MAKILQFAQYVQLNSDLWSNLLRKTAITTTFYFTAEVESVYLGKNRIGK